MSPVCRTDTQLITTAAVLLRTRRPQPGPSTVHRPYFTGQLLDDHVKRHTQNHGVCVCLWNPNRRMVPSSCDGVLVKFIFNDSNASPYYYPYYSLLILVGLFSHLSKPRKSYRLYARSIFVTDQSNWRCLSQPPVTNGIIRTFENASLRCRSKKKNENKTNKNESKNNLQLKYLLDDGESIMSVSTDNTWNM